MGSATAERLWEVVMAPVDEGVVVYLTDGHVRTVVGRVRWKRRGKGSTFKAQLRKVIARANAQMDEANARG